MERGAAARGVAVPARRGGAVIDARATLDAGAGIARGASLIPPGPEQPLWTVAVDIGGLDPSGHRGLAADDYPLHLVGAAGPRPGDALLRGAGEAVERFALRPPAQDDRAAGPGPGTDAGTDAGAARRLPFADPAVALGSPAADPDALSWLTGWDLAGGERVAVPAALVDYPAGDAGSLRWFDPTPSGAAAGAGEEMALRNALHEIVERDAVMVAWAAQLRLERVDLAGLTAARGPGAAHVRDLDRLARAAGDLGLSVTFGAIPTCLRGVECVVGILVDHDSSRPLAAVGTRASACRAEATLGAFREAFQVRAALRGISEWYAAGLPADSAGGYPPVSCDLDRARLWCTPAAVDAVERWTDGFVPAGGRRAAAGPAAPTTTASTTAAVGAPVDDLVADLVRDGARPVAVRLTHRLPAAVQEMGWAVVKVIPVGLHALRMDERHEFTWLRGRIAGAPGRLARSAAVADGGIHPFPHPLI
ncbi:YcaO-like family protein [Parafrankia discariae]|uniref:YcaO-like family protein n=1 Tax=Parafrankia discariae TaxID=365528 RepID=UPI00036906A4|nr:YcaO-like family protein [Parafrankia discariae]